MEGFKTFEFFLNPFAVGFSSSLPCASSPANTLFLYCVDISKGMLQRGRERIFSYKSGRRRAGESP